MKEATGELNMTVITIVAIAVIAGIMALMWPSITNTIKSSWGSRGRNACVNQGCSWVENHDSESGVCAGQAGQLNLDVS